MRGTHPTQLNQDYGNKSIMRKSISQSVIKKLFSNSAGICNLCKIKNEHNEVAHIIAYKPNGARGNVSLSSEYSSEYLNSYNNLILLCPNCHTEIDSNPDKYTVEYLLQCKNQFETFIANQLSLEDKRRIDDCFFIDLLIEYCDLTKLRGYIYSLPNGLNSNFVNLGFNIENIQMDRPSLLPLNNPYLNEYFMNFYKSWFELSEIINGFSIGFNDLEQPNFVQQNGLYIVVNTQYLSRETVNKLYKKLDKKKSIFLNN